MNFFYDNYTAIMLTFAAVVTVSIVVGALALASIAKSLKKNKGE